MESLNLNPFDTWLWALDETTLSALRLPDLRARSHEDQVDLPQLTVATILADGVLPAEVLVRRGTGIVDARITSHAALLLVHAGRTQYVVGVWPAAEGVFHLAGTVPATDAAWQRVEEAWMNAAAPDVSPVILNRGDFEALGDALAEHGDIETTRMTARVLRDRSSYSRGWPRIEGYTRPNHREALAETQEMIVRTLTLDIGRGTQLQIRRNSGASFYRGFFSVFVEVVLARFQSAARERRELLRDRQRRVHEPLTHVLELTVDRVNLDDRRVRDYLHDTIAEVRGLQVSTVHANPYMHLLVTDFLSGANFDVLVTEDHEVQIVPGFNSSIGTLNRVTDAIGNALGMADIRLRERRHEIPESEFFGS